MNVTIFAPFSSFADKDKSRRSFVLVSREFSIPRVGKIHSILCCLEGEDFIINPCVH